MRRVTKTEAMQELGVSLSTLDRMIRRGDVGVERVRHGRRDRVYVMLEGDAPDTVNGGGGVSADTSDDVDLAVALARINTLEGVVDWYKDRLDMSESRYHELHLHVVRALPAPASGRTWWRFWR